MAKAQNNSWKTVIALMERYQKLVIKGLRERWRKFEIEIYDSETYEVIGGLLARQATLTVELAGAPQIWNTHIAPLILRSMTDAHITFAWILKSPTDRAKKYIIYGLGQDKLFVEYLKEGREADKSDPIDEQIEKVIKFKEDWLNSQRRDI
jgi:Family of unknown function (DUF5677)